MRCLAIVFVLSVSCACSWAAEPAKSADSKGSAEPSAIKARPAELDILKLEEGVWDAAIEFPPASPDAAPTTARGVQTNTFVTGNGWIKNDFVVDAKYGGHGTWGFDPKKGKYVGIWVDSNTDYVRFDEGSYDAATRTMTWWSELRQPDPHPPAKFRLVEEFKGDVRVLTMTAIGPKSGKEVPLGKITFTRRPSVQ
jgi:hypothetical protein